MTRNPGQNDYGESIVPVEIDFSAAFDLVPMALLLVLPDDPVFTVIRANKAFLQLGGAQRENLLGQGFFDTYPGGPNHAGFQSLLASYRRAIALRTPDQMMPYRYDLDRSIETGSGSQERYWVSINTPILNSGGKVQYILQSLEEVTGAVAAEERAQHVLRQFSKNDERFEQIVEASGVGLIASQPNEQDVFLVRLDDATRPLVDAGEITQTAARMIAEYLNVNRCAYADVEDDEDTFNSIGDYNREVNSMVGRYTFTQFGTECLRLMRLGQHYIVEDSEIDPRAAGNIQAYRAAGIRALICVPLLKAGRLVAAMAVHSAVPRRWKFDEISLVEQVANRCWESIERSRISRELREAAERYRFLAESIPQMVWTATREGALDYVNDQVTRYFGASSTEVLGAGWLQWVHPEDQAATVDRWRHSLQAGCPYETSFRLLRVNDDSWRWHLVRAHPFAGIDGRITQWVGTCTDFEDQKQSEVTLTERARLAALGADIGVALTQIAGLAPSLQKCAEVIVEHLDVAFARVWTLVPREDILELQASAGLYTHIDGSHSRIPVGSFKIGRIALERRPHLTNDVANDSSISDPEWARREAMVAFAGYPLVVEDRLIGVLGLFARRPLGPDTLTALASISATIAIAIERKRAEAALTQQTIDLKRSNEDLEQFAHVASHDLRSPLNTVRNFTELVVRRHGASLDSEMKQFLEIVRDSATRMSELISALLTYSKLSSPESKTIKPVSAREAYEDAVANLHSAIESAQARIERDQLPEVLTNRTQLAQVFQNLISNSIQYRGDAPPHIRVTAQRQNAFWLFSVIDNGPGIAQEYHSLIFEPFKRLHGHDRPGSGIGLAFCRKFIEREGGTMWVESEQGAGATFRFTLPAVETSPASSGR